MSAHVASAAPSAAVPERLPSVGVRPLQLLVVVTVGVAIWLVPRPAGVDPRAWQLLAIFVATIIGIIVKPLPMGAMAVIGIAATLATRTLTLAEALSGFANGTLWLVFASFCIAAGFIKTGLGERIAYKLVALFGGSTLGLGYSLLGTDLVLAPAITSNAARAGGVVFPVLQAMCSKVIEVDPRGGRQTSAFLTLTAYHANLITSAMFLTAVAYNPLIAQFAAAQKIAITWRLWAVAASVPGVISLILVPYVLSRIVPPGAIRTPDAPVVAKAALRALGPMKRSEWTMATISTALLAAWIFGPSAGIDATAAALVGLAALLLTGVLSWDDITRQHEVWNTFVWFATLVMMATFLGTLGLTGWFSTHVGATFTGFGWVAGFLGLSLTYFYSHYFFASGTAHVSAMYAPILAVALGLGAPPIVAALVLGFFSSLYCGLTHYGATPAPILFGNGYVSLGTWWKAGIIISVVEIAIWVGIGGAWWRLLGLW